jgi:hypothetical protein
MSCVRHGLRAFDKLHFLSLNTTQMDLSALLQLAPTEPSSHVAILAAPHARSFLIIERGETGSSIGHTPRASALAFVDDWILAQYDEIDEVPWFEFRHEICSNGILAHTQDTYLVFLCCMTQSGQALEHVKLVLLRVIVQERMRLKIGSNRQTAFCLATEPSNFLYIERLLLKKASPHHSR